MTNRVLTTIDWRNQPFEFIQQYSAIIYLKMTTPKKKLTLDIKRTHSTSTTNSKSQSVWWLDELWGLNSSFSTGNLLKEVNNVAFDKTKRLKLMM